MSEHNPPPLPSSPPAPAAPPSIQIVMPPPRRRRVAVSILAALVLLLGMLLIFSLLANARFLAAAGGDQGLSGTVLQKGDEHQIAAVYRLTGMIDEEAVAKFERFAKLVQHNPDIRAAVIRIDSGGGSVSASDQIHRLVANLRQQRLGLPVVVSMGGVAASGGYYVAAPADLIYAEPTTITGSIGVIAFWPVVAGLLDKAGVQMVTIRSTRASVWKARGNFWETPDQRVRQNMQDMLDKMQARFEDVVREGRGSKIVTRQETFEVSTPQGPQSVEVTAPFDGQVYLAAQAKDLGLVDRVGYLADAWAAAAQLAKLDNPQVVEYSREKSVLERLVSGQESVSELSPRRLAELTGPQVMMLWRP